ncbi:hypothetical protein GCM10027614_69760 [Micromonospora vulcania]
MTWKRRLVAAGVVLAVLVVAFGVALWGKGPFDERAYPSSRWDKSMADIFDQFQVQVPDCALADLRYWSGDYIDDNLYLTFEADSACVDNFLRDNGLAGGTTVSRDVVFPSGTTGLPSGVGTRTTPPPTCVSERGRRPVPNSRSRRRPVAVSGGSTFVEWSSSRV